jgi:hypothetical protein
LILHRFVQRLSVEAKAVHKGARVVERHRKFLREVFRLIVEYCLAILGSGKAACLGFE